MELDLPSPKNLNLRIARVFFFSGTSKNTFDLLSYRQHSFCGTFKFLKALEENIELLWPFKNALPHPPPSTIPSFHISLPPSSLSLSPSYPPSIHPSFHSTPPPSPSLCFRKFQSERLWNARSHLT